MQKSKQIEDMKDGGTFVLSQELEQMSSELAEINNIIALAKADNSVKAVLLADVIDEFFVDLQQYFYDYFGSQGIIREC